MFHWFGVITNTKGDSLPNWQVECVQLSDDSTVVPIYSDENETPILTASGISNRAKADTSGNYDFFVPEGTYSLRFYDANGVFQRLQRYLPMYGNAPEAAIDAMEAAQVAQEAAELAQAEAEGAAQLAQLSGGATIYATWTALAAATGMTAGDAAIVFEDPGTHTDPVTSETADNAGIYVYSASPAGWERVADTEAVKAAESATLSQSWAEGTLPGGAGTKSAKEWSEVAEAVGDELATIVELLDPLASPDLFVWRDGASNIVGSVGADAAWDVLLKQISTVDGIEVYPYEMVSGAPAFYVVDSNDNVLFNSDDFSSDIIDEITAARGSRSSLDDRVSQSLDDYGSPLDEFNHNRLRRYHYLRRKRLLGESARNIVGLFGDSWTWSTARYSGDFAATLIAEQGDGGGGYSSCGFLAGTNAAPYTHAGTQPQYVNGNIRPASYPVTLNGNWTGSYGTVPTPDTCCATSSTAGDEIRFTFPASPTISGVDLFWIGTASGVAEYSWDGSSWTTINVQGTVGACSCASLTGFPSGTAGILRVRVVSGTCSIGAVNFKSAASGIVLHKLAATGTTLAQLATQAAVASWRTAVAALGINTATVMHGTNDQGAGALPATFATNGEAVLTGLRAGVAGVDILWVMPAENQRTTNTYAMPLYKAAAAASAAAANVAFLDTQRHFGDPANPTEYGSGGAVPLFNADLIHPEPSTGGRALINALLSFMHR